MAGGRDNFGVEAVDTLIKDRTNGSKGTHIRTCPHVAGFVNLSCVSFHLQTLLVFNPIEAITARCVAVPPERVLLCYRFHAM